MKIAVAVCNYLPYRAGITNVAERHAHHLRDVGHEVVVLAPAHDHPAGNTVIDGLQVRRFRQLVRHGNSALVPSIARGIRGADAVYLHYPFYGGAETIAAAAFITGVPLVTFFHMDVLRSGVEGRVLALYERSAAKWILERSDRVFASSLDYAAHSSISQYRLPTLEGFPYAVDTERFRPTDDGPDTDAATDTRRPSVLFVGAMDGGHAFKGVPELIHAFKAANLAEIADLTLIGDGDLRPGYESLAAEMLPQADVRFLGRVPEEDLRATLRDADLLVLPSTTAEEAFGIVLIEAMASGTPVVASALPGVREIITPETGRMVTPGDVPDLADALTELLADDAELRAMSRAARSRAVAEYSQERERERLAEIFGSLRARRPVGQRLRRRR